MKRPLVILAYPKIDHEKDYVYHWMPFSLLTTAKPLLEQGLAEVVLFDGNQRSTDDWELFLDEHLEGALCIGVSILTGGNQIAHAFEMVKSAKSRPGCPPVVFGGPHVNVLPGQTLAHPLVDAVLIGPGQNSMPRFVEALRRGGEFDDVPGLMARLDGARVQGPENPPRTGDLGSYPWQLLDIEEYVKNDPSVSPRTLNYISSQGCIYKCRFCYELTYQRKYSSMAASAMVTDITHLRSCYGVTGVKFYDADFFVNLKRSVEFSRRLIEGGHGLRWAASINPNDVLKARRFHPDMLELAAASGCRRLLMGVESGSDRVLNEIVQKDVTRADILSVAAEIAEHGIMGSYTFIVGFPGETPDEVEDTYSLLAELRTLRPTPETKVHIFAPYPGTPLFDRAVEHGFQPPLTLEGWSGYDYYDTQTPWTDEATVARARGNTNMVLAPGRGVPE